MGKGDEIDSAHTVQSKIHENRLRQWGGKKSQQS